MKQVGLPWSEFKTSVIDNDFPINFRTLSVGYEVFALDRTMVWATTVSEVADVADFEVNYKSLCNKYINPVDDSGKSIVRAETRPVNCTTCFTTCGDTLGANPSIGTGTRVEWNAANGGEFTETGAPSGMKRKVIDLQFCDSLWIPGGACFFKDGHYGSYLDMQVLMPTGGDPVLVDHFVIKWPMTGTASAGSTVDSATISSELFSGLILRFIITVPVADVTSTGNVVIKVYRKRTVVS